MHVTYNLNEVLMKLMVTLCHQGTGGGSIGDEGDEGLHE